jgi:predicted nucleotidyltransferase
LPDESIQSRLERIVELLNRHGVEYLVIGGAAETIFGSARPTFDIDICHRRTIGNLERLAAVLREIKASIRGGPRDLPFVPDARALYLGNNFTFDTTLREFDCLAIVEPLGQYEDLVQHAEEYPLGESRVRTIGLDDLIRIKEYLGRPKDRDSLMHLRAIKQVRGESKQSGEGESG